MSRNVWLVYQSGQEINPVVFLCQKVYVLTVIHFPKTCNTSTKKLRFLALCCSCCLFSCILIVGRCDDVMKRVMDKLSLFVPQYERSVKPYFFVLVQSYIIKHSWSVNGHFTYELLPGCQLIGNSDKERHLKGSSVKSTTWDTLSKASSTSTSKNKTPLSYIESCEDVCVCFKDKGRWESVR